MKALKQTFVGFSLAGYVFLAVFGLLAMGSMHQHSMSSMNDCPFMIGQQALCTMDFAGHITAWQALSNAPTIELLTLFIPLVFVVLFFYLHPPNPARSRLYLRPLRENYTTALFSQGILHPRAP